MVFNTMEKILFEKKFLYYVPTLILMKGNEGHYIF